jgi:DNA repair exonuclease SbcCD ATPase subunit
LFLSLPTEREKTAEAQAKADGLMQDLADNHTLLEAERERRQRAERMLDGLQRKYEENAAEGLRAMSGAGALAQLSQQATDRLKRAQDERDEARRLLGECYKLSGADPDGDDWPHLWMHAVQAVRDLRADSDDDTELRRAEKAEAERDAAVARTRQLEEALRERIAACDRCDEDGNAYSMGRRDPFPCPECGWARAALNPDPPAQPEQ